jgi:hypothetical protein
MIPLTTPEEFFLAGFYAGFIIGSIILWLKYGGTYEEPPPEVYAYPREG